MFVSEKGNCIIIITAFCTVVIPFLTGETCESSEKVNLLDWDLLTVYALDLVKFHT